MVQQVDFSGPKTGPLSGVRVADFTAVYSGPLATTVLADQGATVIKIEPAHGDLMRRALPKMGGLSASFLTLNRNKQSLCIDIRTPQGLEIANKLIETCDVVIENFRPGVMDRLGLGYETLQAKHPKLIYVSINGVGATGPYANRRIYDAVIQAVSGFAALKPKEPPQLVNNLICDKITALTASQAVVAALFERERSQVGQRVEISMLDAALFFLWADLMNNFTYTSEGVEEAPLADLSAFFRKTKDGWVAQMPVQQAEVEGALRALELEELIDDPRFATFEDRVRNREVMRQLTDEAYAKFTTEEICQRLEQYDVPFSTVNLRHEVPDDPQIKAMQALWEFDHPRAGPTRQARPPARFDRTPANFHTPTALLGEHNQLLLEELGYTPEQVAQLVKTEILFSEIESEETSS